jgi:hypothetical protein
MESPGLLFFTRRASEDSISVHRFEALHREHTLLVLLTVGTDVIDVIRAGTWPESSAFEPNNRHKKLDSGPEASPE